MRHSSSNEGKFIIKGLKRESVAAQFGAIDIYLFDQILRGRIPDGARILDAGCGGGRNLLYFLKNNYQVFGVDQDPVAIQELCALEPANFYVCRIENMPFVEPEFDLVISSAVLHFADNDGHFRAMLDACWRAVKPGGMLFCRLASSIGMEKRVKKIKGRRYLLPDGSERYLVDAAMLDTLTRELGAELLDPIKTTIVQDQRCMTTWVLKKVLKG